MKRIFWLRLVRMRLVSALTLFVILLLAQGCENQVQTKRGSVNGSVRDTLNNAIAGATLTSHRSLFKAETDENGRFEFTSLDVGTHRLSVERNGYYLASRTVEIAYGEVLEGVEIRVEPLDEMITHYVARREGTQVLIDVNCKEPMSIVIGWREVTGARIQLPPTECKKTHQLLLTNLFQGSQYIYDLTGTTADGRRYVAETGSFKAVPYGDLAGAPDTVSGLKVDQGTEGPVLSWVYSGADPLQGFRIHRSENDGALSLIQNENNVFAVQTSVVDDTAIPGRIYRYAMQAVDLDGNVSSMSALVSIMPGGTVSENLVWKKSWSPIDVDGDLIVPAGRTLKIEAGCVVRFAAADNGKSGFRPSVCELIVDGTILAEGTLADPIRLISASAVPSRTGWDGVRLTAAAGQEASILKFLEVSGAERGVTLYSSNAEIGSFTARYCQTGFSLQGASGTILTGMQFEDCETAFTAENTWNCSLEDLKVRNSTIGVLLAGNGNFSLRRFDLRGIRETALTVADKEPSVFRNGLIQSLRTGLTIGAAGGDYQYLTIDAGNGVMVEGESLPIIKNCIIVNRNSSGTGYGIEDRNPGTGRSYPYNDIYGFSQATFGCDQLGAPVINLDPLFVGGKTAEYDYRLQSSSPVITASDKNAEPGAYGSSS